MGNGVNNSSSEEQLMLTVLMPCLNEEDAIPPCMDSARRLLRECLDGNVSRGEILLVDNGSADRSAEIAGNLGARVITEPVKGYGSALRRGIREAKGKVIIMGDCDTTYDFEASAPMYRMIADEGYDMVIGDRFKGGIEPGAMQLSHRIGVRALSFFGRLRFHTDVHDFHSGIRAMSLEAASQLEFGSTGMEFATEMIAEAAKHGLKIGQLPVRLYRCSKERTSKLNTIRDGVRHLRFILKGVAK